MAINASWRYANVTGKKVTEKKTKNFSNICDWFVDNKLSIYFGGINEITILFSTKN